MKKILLIILLITLKVYSQEIVEKNEIYVKDNLVYKLDNSQLFSGKTQSFKHKNHLVFEKVFENGVLKKYIIYFNGKTQIVSDETYYYNNRKVEKKIKYSLDHKTLWIKCYDEFGNKTLEEDYKNGGLIYSCPYSNNKKNGKVFSINEKGERNECNFENGKLIK
jgi:antitoxin component YwqK of YwqJK toxin-antitoxin module